MPLAAHDMTVAADPSRGRNIGLEDLQRLILYTHIDVIYI